MSELSIVEESIKYSIKKHGFPKNSVRLPFKAIHESCKNHNVSLKQVLANLVPSKIIGTLQGDFIEFQTSDKIQEKPKTPGKKNDASGMNLPNMENLKEMAQLYMSKISPEQIKELEKTVSNMSEEDRKNLLKNFSEQFFKNNP